MKGITGKKLDVTKDLAASAESIKKIKPNCILAIGFGIEKRSDVEEILKIADMAVVGSAVIREINRGGNRLALKLVSQLV